MPVVVTVGKLWWPLGIEYAVTAFAHAHARVPALRYEIIGRGPERERVVYTAFDLGVDGAVRVIEPEPDVVDRIRDAHVFLWPSLIDELPSALKVADDAGLSVISTVPGSRGVTVGKRDPAAIATALVEAANRATRSSSATIDVSSELVRSVLEDAGCASR